MPTLSATTSAAFAAAGIDATDVYTFFTTLFGYAISALLWVVTAIWPFLVVIGIILLFIKVAGHALHMHGR